MKQNTRLLMLVLRHPMRVALALAATMLSLAGVYALLGVHAIAIFQVLIYVGAVMVFMKLAFPLFPDAARLYAPLFGTLAVVSIIYGACLALVQTDIKKIIAYSSISFIVCSKSASVSPGKPTMKSEETQMSGRTLRSLRIFCLNSSAV